MIFFALGRRLASTERHLSIWLAAPCALAVVLLAPLNHGCSFSRIDLCGETELKGQFGVWVVDGKYGFLPLFYLTAFVGCVGVLALARSKWIAPLQWLGRRSLELFLLNGFFLMFIVPALKKRVYVQSLSAAEYALIFATVLGAHCIALLIVQRPLLALQNLSAGVGERTVRRIASRVDSRVA